MNQLHTCGHVNLVHTAGRVLLERRRSSGCLRPPRRPTPALATLWLVALSSFVHSTVFNHVLCVSVSQELLKKPTADSSFTAPVVPGQVGVAACTVLQTVLGSGLVPGHQPGCPLLTVLPLPAGRKYTPAIHY